MKYSIGEGQLLN